MEGKLHEFCADHGKGVKNPENLAEVIYGWPHDLSNDLASRRHCYDLLSDEVINI